MSGNLDVWEPSGNPGNPVVDVWKPRQERGCLETPSGTWMSGNPTTLQTLIAKVYPIWCYEERLARYYCDLCPLLPDGSCLLGF
jgi:hypothetical protein